jgi:hypothetical protein
MRVYILDADVNTYRGIYYTRKDIVDFNRRFDGRSMRKTWKDSGSFAFVPRRMSKGDTPGLSTHIPVFSLKAVNVLADLLKRNGELLPITCDDEAYFVFNVTRVIDALDERESELDLYNSGKIMNIARYSFFEDKLASASVFKIPQFLLGRVFVTAPFVARVKEANLIGFKFRPVWSSDDD